MKKLLKMSLLLKKKDFGEDTFIYGTLIQFLKNLNATILLKVKNYIVLFEIFFLSFKSFIKK